LHVNEVVPTANSEPDAGEQLVEIGVTPPVTVGVNVTDIGFPSGDVNTGEGHEIARVGADTRPETSGDGGPFVPPLS
jgi:hypothetical protein